MRTFLPSMLATAMLVGFGCGKSCPERPPEIKASDQYRCTSVDMDEGRIGLGATCDPKKTDPCCYGLACSQQGKCEIDNSGQKSRLGGTCNSQADCMIDLECNDKGVCTERPRQVDLKCVEEPANW